MDNAGLDIADTVKHTDHEGHTQGVRVRREEVDGGNGIALRPDDGLARHERFLEGLWVSAQVFGI